MSIARILDIYMVTEHMKKTLTIMDIKDSGLRIYYRRLKNILLEVEVYHL
ncbi:MAG TPA: hypothetical protein QF658_03175 [Pelagibacteraceae bacterium]|jgi:hypothetical protein|nr:hypothetical protein [Pelagibacteraceae bacterium]